jgi:serine/threonine-protein kinase
MVSMPAMSPAADQKYFCHGLSQEIIHTLTGMDAMRLVAGTPAADVDGYYDVREAANRLNAALIVSGSVRRSGNEARITTNLIDAASGCYLWSGSIDRKMENTFAIQEEVARAVAEQLKTELAGGARSKGAGRLTGNLAAYNLYLQGRYHLNQRTEDSLRKAAEFFDGLAQFYRKGYLTWIDATKKSPDERARRITQTVKLLKSGVKQRPK